MQPRRSPAPALLAAAAGATAYAYYRRVYRRRDPVRMPPKGRGLAAPADGKVKLVRRIERGRIHLLDYSQQKMCDLSAGNLGLSVQGGWLLGLELGPLNARYIYAPANAKVRGLRRSTDNSGTLSTLLEQQGMGASDLLAYNLQTDEGGVLDVIMARQGSSLDATTYFEEGQAVRRGNKLAFLEAGDMVLLAFAGDTPPAAHVGQHLTGAETLVTGDNA